MPLKEAVPGLHVTCYAIPNKLGPVHELRKKYPWITFGIHGWEHTHFECRSWTQDDAVFYIKRAQEMGYDSVFKAPNWTFDEEVERACEDLGVILHHHADKHQPTYKHLGRLYPGPKNRRRNDHINLHTHLQSNPVTDSIQTHTAFRPERLAQFSVFLTPSDVCVGGL